MVKSLRIGREGASAIVDTGLRGVPFGALHQGLLDALTHAIPHDELGRWSGDIGDVVGYPCRIPSMKFFGEMPRSGEARVEVRFAGFEGAAVSAVHDSTDRRRRGAGRVDAGRGCCCRRGRSGARVGSRGGRFFGIAAAGPGSGWGV
jgi:hypothetical protein